MPVDSVIWATVAFVLTAIGAGWTYLSWRRRGLPAAVRGMGWTLLPVAAWLTGTLRLGGEIVGAFGRWASRLVLDPFTWAGIVLAGVSVVLLGASRVLERRGIGARGRLSQRGRGTPVGQQRGGAQSDASVADNDVEAILNKHGIR